MHRRQAWLAATVVACATPLPAGDGTGDETDAVDSVLDTDPIASGDTEPVDQDSDPTVVDTDSDADSDAPPAPPPPADWGPGFVELPFPASARALVVDPGDKATARPPQATVVILADLDEDDVPELLTASRTSRLTSRWAARVLRWTAAGLVDDDALSDAVEGGETSGRWVDTPLAAFDVDGDGHVDLLGGSPERAVRYGTGPGTWGAWEGLGPTGDHTNDAVTLADLDADGWLDLALGGEGCDDAGWVALRTGTRTWDLRNDVLVGTTTNARALLASVTPDGRPFLYVVDDWSCATVDPRPRFFHQTGVGAGLRPQLSAFDPTPVDTWWKLLPAFHGLAPDRMSPMGAGAEDLDGDGLLDLVITVGTPPQVILRGEPDGSYADEGGWTSYVRPSGPTQPEFPWSVGFPDVDLDGRPEILWTIGDDESSFMVEDGHPMRNALSWNAGDFHFVDVEAEVGLTAEGSWRALALGDPDGDGDADVVVGGHGRPPVAWRNDVDVDGRAGVTIRLIGTTSNALALGAELTAEVRGLPVRHATVGVAGNPLGASPPLTFLGCGTAPTLDHLTVRWPTGLVQTFDDLEVGRLHTLTEPPTVEVLDDDRHAAANARERLALRVTPRGLDGEIDPAARVELAFEGVVPTLAEPLRASPDGVWTAALRSGAPGVTAIVVRIDGVELAVHPKVWWNPPL